MGPGVVAPRRPLPPGRLRKRGPAWCAFLWRLAPARWCHRDL